MSTDPVRLHGMPLTRFPALDGLRGVAALMVFATHASFLTGMSGQNTLVGRVLARGDFGVALFFALSGFLLSRQLHHSLASTGSVRGGRYLLRRVARIFPAYWLTLGVLAVLTSASWRDVIVHALGLQIYVSDSSIAAFGQSWSVATEFSFYLVLPLLALGLHRLRAYRPQWVVPLLCSAVAATSLSTLLVPAAVLGQDLVLERLLPWRAPFFLIGILVAEMLITPTSRSSRWLRPLAAQPAAAVALAASAYLAGTTPIAGSLLLEPTAGVPLFLRTLLACVVAGALLVPLTLGPASTLTHLLSRPTTRWLGTVSYGVFLWHLPVLEGLYALSGAPPFRGGILPLVAVGLPLSLFLGWMSHSMIELPASRLAARWTRDRRKAEGDNQGDTDPSLDQPRSR